jgi:hypothetical protein
MPGTSAIRFATVTIANGAAVSSNFDLVGYRIIAVISPAVWTAADIGFRVETANQSGVFVDVVASDGVIYSLKAIEAAVAEYHMIGGAPTSTSGTVGYAVDPVISSPGRAQVVSFTGGAQTEANQGAARTLVVVMEACAAGF